MTLRIIAAVPCVLGAALACAANHHHLTVASFSTPEGSKTVILAGYYPIESDVWIAPDGRVMEGDRFLVVDMVDDFADPGPFQGWAGSFEMLLTSDYYFATGLLDGGDFRYEIVSVEVVGGDGPSEMVWGRFDEDTLEFLPDAFSAGITREERSLSVGIGAHDHAQGALMSSSYGAYDVTLVAWDANGVYLDSDPVVIRFAVHPCPTDFDRNGFVNGDDFDAFIAYFLAGDPAADFDGNTFVNGDDFDAFVAAFDGGC